MRFEFTYWVAQYTPEKRSGWWLLESAVWIIVDIKRNYENYYNFITLSSIQNSRIYCLSYNCVLHSWTRTSQNVTGNGINNSNDHTHTHTHTVLPLLYTAYRFLTFEPTGGTWRAPCSAFGDMTLGSIGTGGGLSRFSVSGDHSDNGLKTRKHKGPEFSAENDG